MDISLLREAILPPKTEDGPGVICGSLVGVLEVLPRVERGPAATARGDGLGTADVGDVAGRTVAAVGEAAERVDDGLDFLPPPPPPPLLAPPKRASRFEAWSRL